MPLNLQASRKRIKEQLRRARERRTEVTKFSGTCLDAYNHLAQAFDGLGFSTVSSGKDLELLPADSPNTVIRVQIRASAVTLTAVLWLSVWKQLDTDEATLLNEVRHDLGWITELTAEQLVDVLISQLAEHWSYWAER